jgi:hypothetical protein
LHDHFAIRLERCCRRFPHSPARTRETGFHTMLSFCNVVDKQEESLLLRIEARGKISKTPTL